MKRFLLFQFADIEGYDGEAWYQGWDAFEGDYDTIEEIQECLKVNTDPGRAEIVDTETKAVVMTCYYQLGYGTGERHVPSQWEWHHIAQPVS